MSGGHFNYDQYRIGEIATEIEEIINTNDSPEVDDYGCSMAYGFTPETLAKFREAVAMLRKAYVMVHRIDWLVCSDDGEDTFHERWTEELAKLAE